MAEPLKIFCGNCEAKLDVSDFRPFDLVHCPVCGTRLRVPRNFDRYLLERECGHGGVSVVYQAIEPQLARRVAVKLLLDLSPDGRIDPGLLEVARLVARLNHPGFIPIYRCGCAENRSFVAMRFMEHGDLERLMLSRNLPDYGLICYWLAHIAEGLSFAWQKQQIVHHDVKPSNIMLTAENEAKLGDFDLADHREEGDCATQCQMWGSPAYVSPERLMFGGEDFKGDIFSLGATGYELLSGVAPFGLSGETEDLYRRREKGEKRPLLALCPGLPANLAQLIDRMLSFTPAARPGYDDVIAGLKNCARAPVANENLVIPAVKFGHSAALSPEWQEWLRSKPE